MYDAYCDLLGFTGQTCGFRGAFNYQTSKMKCFPKKINPFQANVPSMEKPGGWSLLAKCVKNTYGRVTFYVKMQVVKTNYLNSS